MHPWLLSLLGAAHTASIPEGREACILSEPSQSLSNGFRLEGRLGDQAALEWPQNGSGELSGHITDVEPTAREMTMGSSDFSPRQGELLMMSGLPAHLVRHDPRRAEHLVTRRLGSSNRLRVGMIGGLNIDRHPLHPSSDRGGEHNTEPAHDDIQLYW